MGFEVCIWYGDPMSENNEIKRYKAYKIPHRQQDQVGGFVQASLRATAEPISSLSNEMFYEIDYDSYPIPGVGKFVLKPQKIEQPEKDEIRDLFDQMRDIARAHRSAYDYSKFFDRRVHQDNALIFYKQGMFMKDFSDHYSGNTQFSQYFPYYQMMGYEQLRTYFTWRTEVRKGNVADTALSYAFLYIYELLGNIGVNDPKDGLEKLMFFWKAFRLYNQTIDKYVLRWLKDYHIYYDLPQSFKEFIKENNLTEHYPQIADMGDNFDLFCAVSKYDIRKSNFFTEDKMKLITDCFYFVTDRLRQIFLKNGIHFEESIFQPTKKMSVWIPFKGALFYQWVKQSDRQIVLSGNEIYICSQNKWAFNTVITSESGRQLISYVLKQMEAVLRRVMKYQFKLSANINTVTHSAVGKLKEAGLSLESMINDAVMAFYREATKTVVKVDLSTLSIIRQEALAIQEKLIVEEQEEQASSALAPLNLSLTAPQEMPPLENEPVPVTDAWESLKNVLTETEIKALSVVLYGEIERRTPPAAGNKEFDRVSGNPVADAARTPPVADIEGFQPTPGSLVADAIKKFADECGVMAEVLVDGINEKAMDYIGDNLMDDAFVIYEDYKNQVKEMVG